jgi:16S rRNA (cytosine967-C5)-methyltransferase
MTRPARYTARAAALAALRQYSTRRGDAAELLHSLLSETDRSGQATDLVYGVIRNTVLLDRLLNVCATVKKDMVKPALWTILRLGVYELVFAPKTAEYAILHEAVNLAHGFSTRKGSGFVNAVLRSVQRQITARDGDATASETTQVVPRADGSVCVFGSAVLPDPGVQPAEYLHFAWSLPLRLVREWLGLHGPTAAAELCRASNRHPSVYAWPDTRRLTAETLAEKLAAEGVQCRLWPERGAVQLRGGGPLTELAGFREGLFYIQDPAAEAIAAFLDPQPGETLIDVCAAPGGKTIALALRMKDTGRILASDANAARLSRLEENIRRLHLSCVQSIPEADVAAHAKSLNRLDAVILDVPCSNTGVLARRVEARRRLEGRPEKTLLMLQQALLQSAKGLLKSGSKLLYSTCSIQPEENERQIRNFLSNNPDFYLIKQQRVLPSAEKAIFFDHDGGYMALLARQ